MARHDDRAGKIFFFDFIIDDFIKSGFQLDGGYTGCRINAINVRVFAKAGNSLIVLPGTNAHLRICC
jgi:hypothetical protein